MSRGMLSAVVFLSESEARKTGAAVAVGRSLASLVDASLAGLLKDVLIAGPLGLDLGLIAEHAGCDLIEAAQEKEWLPQALRAVKGRTTLALKAGYLCREDLLDVLRVYLDKPPDHAGLCRAEPEHWRQRVFPHLAPIAAVIAPTGLWRVQEPAHFQAMARGLKPRPLPVTLRRVG